MSQETPDQDKQNRTAKTAKKAARKAPAKKTASKTTKVKAEPVSEVIEKPEMNPISELKPESKIIKPASKKAEAKPAAEMELDQRQEARSRVVKASEVLSEEVKSQAPENQADRNTAGDNEGGDEDSRGRRRNRNRNRNRNRKNRSVLPALDASDLSKKAWKIFTAEVAEEGLALVDDNTGREIAKRAFRLAEIFLGEQSRLQTLHSSSSENEEDDQDEEFDD